VRCHLTARSGMIARMQSRGIALQRCLNGYALIQWLVISGSPYSDSWLHSSKLSFLNCSFQDSLTSNISLAGTLHMQSIFRSEFWLPKHVSNQILVKSAFKALRTLASFSKCGTWVSGRCQPSCRIAEQNQSSEILTPKLQLFWQSPNLQKLYDDLEV